MGFNVTVTPVVQEVDISASVQAYEVEIIVNSDIKKYADEAKASADQAEASAISADNSADSALASATSATASANSASSSASSASNSASTATTQAGIATTKANEASQSASNALASEQASAISEANALQSEQNALASEQSAFASANTATSQAGIATTKAGEASASASSALASQNSATASASTATTQAGIATTQASNALASANAAAASAASAAQVGTSTLLTGFSVGANTAIAGTDSILQAFNKTQGQINARVSGTGTTNTISKFTASGIVGNSQIVDNGLALGIGATSPASRIHVLGTTDFETTFRIERTSTSTLIIGSTYLGTFTNTQLQFFSNSLERARFSNTGQFWIGTTSGTQTIDVNGTGRIRNGVSLADTSGNVQIGTTTDAGFRLDVNGTTRLNGLQTFQGTTASDTAPLGSELATTGSGTNWTGTGFATGYTHTVGSTASLTTSIPAVNGTYYQIAYTITGRTAGSITINYGGTSTASITATGATGPLSTSTANLEIVPTTDFDGTVVLSVRSIGTSSATTTFRNSSSGIVGEIRANSNAANLFIGIGAGSRNTSGANNSLFGTNAGQNITSASFNTVFGNSALQLSSTGSGNSVFGSGAGGSITIGGSNALFGRSSGGSMTSAITNSAFGTFSALNITSSNNGLFFGFNAGRFLANGSTPLTIANNSLFIGVDTRANADSETNQIVIGNTAIGLGSNTTVIGNSSTTFGRWWGNLLLGTSTNSGFLLDVNGTARVQGNTTVTGNLTVDTNTLFVDSVNDKIGIGTTSLSGVSVKISTNLSDGTTPVSVLADGTITSSATTNASYFQTLASTQASTFTLPVLVHYRTAQGTFGLNSVVSNQYGFFASSGLIGATNNFAFRGEIPAGTGRWNLFMSGTADNAIAGAMHIGSTTVPNAVAQLEVSSTTKGFLPPRMTTAQRDLIAAVAGLVIYNTTTNKHQGHNGTAWQDFY